MTDSLANIVTNMRGRLIARACISNAEWSAIADRIEALATALSADADDDDALWAGFTQEGQSYAVGDRIEWVGSSGPFHGTVRAILPPRPQMYSIALDDGTSGDVLAGQLHKLDPVPSAGPEPAL